jgi:hypothetical protein
MVKTFTVTILQICPIKIKVINMQFDTTPNLSNENQCYKQAVSYNFKFDQ